MNLLLILASLVSLFHYNHPTVEKIGKEENENIDPKIAKITRSKSIKTRSQAPLLVAGALLIGSLIIKCNAKLLHVLSCRSLYDTLVILLFVE